MWARVAKYVADMSALSGETVIAGLGDALLRDTQKKETRIYKYE